MKTVCLLFPHQLFRDHPFVAMGQPVILVEESLFFRQFQFHRKKLILHRASMKAYEEWLIKKGIRVRYIDTTVAESDCRILVALLAEEKVTDIFICDVVDDWLRRRLIASCKKYGITLTIDKSPNFFNTVEGTASFFEEKKGYFQTDFYIRQRKDRRLLLDHVGRPLGGKWSFDAANRKKIPRGQIVPDLAIPPENKYITEARQYVANHFPFNYGKDDGQLLYGVTFEEADNWLETFVSTRLDQFGTYEDAMVTNEPFLFHSIMSPMLNIGLLDPQTIIQKIIETGESRTLPLNSIEGFVRQVVGWREFIHLLYEREGRYQRTRNFWNFSRKIPASFWAGETGIGPVDMVIRRVLNLGYCHHIERLMVLGNFMLLCEFDPDEVYRWFMELFIDAYDWVMVPNVYGMTQFSDGGLMTTKPYISGSNYLMKMGDFKKGDWQKIWDGLFWRFLDKHRDFFRGNQRLGMLVQTFERMEPTKKKAHLAVAEAYLRGL